jgi:putative inorganic carbon (hco3(-)) transporter
MSLPVANWHLASSFALSKIDPIWSDILENSTLVSTCKRMLGRLRASDRIAAASKFISTSIALFLLAALPLPQFAADKEGLAVLAICGIAFYVISRLRVGATVSNNGAADMLVLAILGTNIVSAFASHYFQASLVGLTKVLVYVLSYFWFAGTLAAGRKRSATAVSILLASGLATALYGLYQYHIGVQPLATWEDPTVEQKATRIYSTLGNPNLLAGFLTPLAPLAAALGFMCFFKRRYLLSAIPFTAALVLSAAIILTGSRGAYIAFAAWLIFLVVIISLYTFKTKAVSRLYLLLIPIGLAFGSVAAIHYLPSLGQRLASIFAGSEHSSNAFRLNVWRASWRMFMDNWWFGIGPGNKTFILAYGLYMLSGFDALGTYCVPLEVAVETGLPGLLLFASLVVALLARAHLVFRTSDSDWDRWLSAGCAAALVGIMVHGLVDTVFFRPQVQFIFWLLVALIASTYRRTFIVEKLSAIQQLD